MKNKKQEIIDFLNESDFNEKELNYIYDFAFYLYTGDLDLIENELKALINRDKNSNFDTNFEIIGENEYMKYDIDTDGSRYLTIRRDVQSYDHKIGVINEILNSYSKKIDNKSYYIKGNYLFFTIDNIKYYTIVSDFADEELYINDIINELNLIGCSRVMYKYGVLD